MNRDKIRILIADDHDILREGLRALLEAEDDMQVVADVGDGRAAISRACELMPDVVVMDIGMPDLNGVDATRRIKRRCPTTHVLCLSVHREKPIIEAMLKAGATGYLLKTSARRELVEAVRTVAAGQTYLCPLIAGDMVEHLVRGSGRREDSGAYSRLTEREREVLQLIAEGHHTKAIAERLHIRPKTVLAHRESLMRTLGLDSVAALTRYALRAGIAHL